MLSICFEGVSCNHANNSELWLYDYTAMAIIYGDDYIAWLQRKVGYNIGQWLHYMVVTVQGSTSLTMMDAYSCKCS